MDIKTLASYIGKFGIISLKGLEIEVAILDVKQVYGASRFLVSPIAGKGSIWVENLILQESKFMKDFSKAILTGSVQ